MAWLARSIANSLKLDEEEEDDETNTNQSPSLSSVSESQSPRGVKEDISELTKTLRSQFWGVASFLAPPTEKNQSPDRDGDNNDVEEEEEEEDEDLIAGIRNDFAEIGGRFKTGISKLSGNLPVSEFTKIASSFLQLGSESVDPKDYESIGITEDLVAFVKDLAIHPENWLDFALPDEDDDEDNFHNFEMTDAQHEHALAIERLVPSLASLRIELCPEYMNENCFWKIYFVLVHQPKLNKQDSSISILSTPQVLELNKSPVEVEEEAESSSEAVKPLDAPLPESETVKTVNQDIETEKHPIDESKEIQVVNEERNNTSHASSSSRVINVKVEDEEDDDTDDDWLKDEEEEASESVTAIKRATKNGEDVEEEEVSFSDLEEDDDDDEGGDKKVTNSGSSDSSSSKYSTDWVKLKDNELM